MTETNKSKLKQLADENTHLRYHLRYSRYAVAILAFGLSAIHFELPEKADKLWTNFTEPKPVQPSKSKKSTFLPKDVNFTYVLGPENYGDTETIYTEQMILRDASYLLGNSCGRTLIFGDGVNGIDYESIANQIGIQSKNVKHNITMLDMHGTAKKIYDKDLKDSIFVDATLPNDYLYEDGSGSLDLFLTNIADATRHTRAPNTVIINTCFSASAIAAASEFQTGDMCVFLSPKDQTSISIMDRFFSNFDPEKETSALSRPVLMEKILLANSQGNSENRNGLVITSTQAYAEKMSGEHWSKTYVIDLTKQSEKLHSNNPVQLQREMKDQGYFRSIEEITYSQKLSKTLSSSKDWNKISSKDFFDLTLTAYSHSIANITQQPLLDDFFLNNNVQKNIAPLKATRKPN